MLRDEGDYHASVFILRPDNKTVLVRKERDGQEPGPWVFPGGKKRQTKDFLAPRRGERPVETAIREVREETGVIIKKRKLIYLGREEVSNPNNGPYNKHFFFFHSHSRKTLRPLSDEYEGVRNFNIDQLHELVQFDRYYYHQYVMLVEPYLKDYLSGKR